MRRESNDEAMEVMVDTGADGFYVSESCLQELTEEMGSAPSWVSLVLGDHRPLLAKLETMPDDSIDFLMGVDLLHRCYALVHYSGHSITFTRSGRRFRVPTRDLE